MPLDLKMAYDIVLKEIPSGKIQTSISYKDLFIFQVFTDKPFEENWDPFYSVNKKTGEFRDFSILTDSNPEIVSLFEKAKGVK